MFELLLLLGLLIVAMVVVGALGLVGGLILLPFRLLGFVFKMLGLLLGVVIAVPFLIVGVLLATLVGGTGLAVLIGLVALPLLPFLALGALIWWLLRPRGPRRPEPSGATVVG